MNERMDSHSTKLIHILSGLWPVRERVVGYQGAYETLTLQFVIDNEGIEKEAVLIFGCEQVDIVRRSEFINMLEYNDSELRRSIQVVQLVARKANLYRCYKNHNPNSLNGFDRGTYQYEFRQMFSELVEHLKSEMMLVSGRSVCTSC